MTIKAPPGVFDILPYDNKELWRTTHLWHYVEEEIRKITREYGYSEIRTPLLERNELFQRGVGEETDIVSKEMYTFQDRGGRTLSLRPEGTAPVIRAFNEHHLGHTRPYHKLYYLASMFRYERAQAGRYRQHHQFGAEVIGIAAPEQDAELIDMLYSLFQRLQLKNVAVCLNSLGGPQSRAHYRQRLCEYLQDHCEQLSEESRRRMATNPLRVLDSKDSKDVPVIAAAPSILDSLDEEDRDHFQQVQTYLRLLKIPFVVNPKIVRGLDYYNKTVFEMVSTDLGSQNSVGGGGRYDGLLRSLGGEDLPALGFGAGIERILQVMIAQGSPMPLPPRVDLFLIPLGERAKERLFTLQRDLRERHLLVQMDFSGRKLGKIMQYADQIAARYVAVVGDNELDGEKIELKEMQSGMRHSVPLSVEDIISKIGEL